MEEKGEFEQRPEVRPADQIPLPKAKPSPALKIMCVIFALIALGAGGYLVYDKVINKKDDVKCADVTKEEEKPTVEEELLGDENHSFVYSPSVHGSNYGQYYITNDGDVYFWPNDYYVDAGESVKWTPTMAKETGEKGLYELKYDDIRGSRDWASEDDDSFKLDGFKLNLSGVRFMTEIVYGQQKVGVEAAFIDKDGNVSLLLGKDDGNYPRQELVLKKNVDKNAVTVLPVYDGDGYNTMVFYRDGSSKKFDYKVFEIK